MQIQKVHASPAAKLYDAVIEVQETALRNTQLDCKRNEALAQQEHIRFVTNKVAYLHLRCNPFIV
jgi:hypothetical protein